MNARIKELDYLKCLFIILMVIFHLVYINETYPYAKKIVYTFHMPAFLIISGYLTNIDKSIKRFLRTMLWIFIPYAFMEVGYVVMSSILPVRESVTEISIKVLLNKIFISPMGPYWYVHTLIICSVIYYLIYRLLYKLNNFSCFILLISFLFLAAELVEIISFSNAIYFLMGVAIAQSKISFTQLFQPSLFAILPFILLCSYPENLDKGTVAGIIITYMAISIALFLYNFFPYKLRQLTYFIGQNTLVILLFSPIFTMIFKIFVPLFAFDPTGILFMCVAVAVTISGCIAIARIMDISHLSRFFFGKKRVLYYGKTNF